MEYLLKVSAIIAIFYLTYKLFLQRDTFFESNRWFLLLGLVSSFLIPFIVIPIYIEYKPVNLDTFSINEIVSSENTKKPFNILDYFPIIYGLGLLFFSVRFIVQLLSLGKIILKSKILKKERYTFIETQADVSPFSFFKWIVYNPSLFSQLELEQIISHEKTHAKQYHSVDILLAQLCCIILWFNPFIWLFNKHLKQNLEFIADKATLNQNHCKKSYQYTLLKTIVPSHQMALSNHFYNSLIKKRIVMLHKSKSKKINQLKYVLVIPVIALFLMSFNAEEVYVEKQNPEKTYTLETLKKDSIVVVEEYKVIITKDFTDADFKKIIEDAQKNGVKLTFNNIKRNNKNEIISINASFKNDDNGSGTFNLNGKEPIKSFAYTQNDEGFGFQTVWETKFIVGKAMDDVKVIGYGNKTDNTSQIIVKGVSNANGTTPLIIIDGKEIPNKNLNETIKQDDIYSIDILKDEKTKSLYGEKAQDGVILITSKEKAETIEGKTMNNVTVVGYGTMSDSTKTIRIGHKLDVGKDKHPLVIVDGKEISNKEIKDINPDDVESTNVLKGETAILKYGEKAKNGVVEITTKK